MATIRCCFNFGDKGTTFFSHMTNNNNVATIFILKIVNKQQRCYHRFP